VALQRDPSFWRAAAGARANLSSAPPRYNISLPNAFNITRMAEHGLYAAQLRSWLAAIPAHHFVLIPSSTLASEPLDVLTQLVAHVENRTGQRLDRAMPRTCDMLPPIGCGKAGKNHPLYRIDNTTKKELLVCSASFTRNRTMSSAARRLLESFYAKPSADLFSLLHTLRDGPSPPTILPEAWREVNEWW